MMFIASILSRASGFGHERVRVSGGPLTSDLTLRVPWTGYWDMTKRYLPSFLFAAFSVKVRFQWSVMIKKGLAKSRLWFVSPPLRIPYASFLLIAAMRARA